MACKVYSDYLPTRQVAVAFQRLQERCLIKASEAFLPSRAEIMEDVCGATVITCCGRTEIDEAIIDAAGPSLKAICTFTAGYNHIDLVACKKRNIRVGYLGDKLAGCMAEFTIGLMIATGHRFKEAIAQLPRNLNGFQLMNSTVGLVGLGNIGQEVVKRLQACDVQKILYCGPRRKPEGDILGVQFTTFEALLRESDFVVVTCALNGQTRGLFNRTAFNLMKPTSIFINVARGAVVDQEALHEALTSNKIFAAGLDVITPEPLPDGHPLIALKNCVLLPHIGTDVSAVRRMIAEVNIDNILAAIDGEPMPVELQL